MEEVVIDDADGEAALDLALLAIARRWGVRVGCEGGTLDVHDVACGALRLNQVLLQI